MGWGVGFRAAWRALGAACAGGWLLVAGAASAAPVQSHFFTSSDGVKLHYLEAGPASAPTLVFVPGWTMPAWIWERQIQAFAGARHVIAFDPRGQGDSEIAKGGYEPGRRGQDLGELIERLGSGQVVVVAWSLGVLDTLAYVRNAGDGRIAGLVLVDNSVGEGPPPAPRKGTAHTIARGPFVRGMFQTRQDADFLRRLTLASQKTPEAAARALRAYPWPRSDWRETLHGLEKPVLYVIRPHLQGQARDLTGSDPFAESVLFAKAGHALFIDETDRFDRVVADFIARRVWPAKAAP
jgi:microsomal epoxide hydrolase